MFRHAWLALLLFFASLPALGAPTVTIGAGAQSSQATVTIVASDTSDSRAIPTDGICTARVSIAGSDVVELWGVNSTETAATSGTQVSTDFTASTAPDAPYVWKAGTTHVKVKGTTATTGGSVVIIDCQPLTSASSGGGTNATEVTFTSTFTAFVSGNVRIALDYLYEQFMFADIDDDGEYESAYIYDADGDGSGYVACTEKDFPDTRCKASGEILYPDWADDLNCMMHGCGFGKMEVAGSIYHRAGVAYINFPCWHAAEPANFNDPEATTEALRDSVADTAWTHCPQTPDFASSGRRFMTVATLGWQGELIGAGVDPRNPDTTTGYKRDTGSYIVDDRGPSWASGAQANLNSWFGVPSFIRGVNFGFDSGSLASGSASNAGEFSGDGDSTGAGTISGTQLLTDINGDICVTESGGWPTDLRAGDIIEVQGTSQTATFASATVIAALRVRDTPVSTDCNGAGTAAIKIGGRAYLGTGDEHMIDPPLTTQLTSGMTVIHARSDYLNNSVRIAGFTVTPQDYWNETGGDCSGVGVWSSTIDGAALDVVPGGDADFDCDTNLLFGLFGGGTPVIEDVVIKNWHNHGVDGNSNVGSPLVRRVTWMYGNGGTIMDPGFGWRGEDLEIRDSQFNSDMIAGFSPGLHLEKLRIFNSSFQQMYSLGSTTGISVENVFRDVRVFNSAFGRLFLFTCGARLVTIDGVQVSGHTAYGVSQTNGAIARFSCATPSNPIESNLITDVVYAGVGDASGTAGTAALVLLDFDDVDGTAGTASGINAAAIARNRFENFRFLTPETAAGSEACIFGVQDDEATDSREDGTDDFSNEDVFTLNTFSGSSIRASGGITARVYCQCGLWDGGGAGDNASNNECDKAIKGSAAGGGDPRGCLNIEGTAKPSFEVCS